MSGPLTHFDDAGAAHMVDVSDKDDTARSATAAAYVRMHPETLDLLAQGAAGKGDVIGTARLAGIMGAKRCAELIPLCHPLPLSKVSIEMTVDADLPGVRIEATAKTTGKTGVEMEALTAASVCALTVYDMLKAAEKGMEIGGVRLLHKIGGKSGEWRA